MSDATGSVKDFLAWQKALYHDEILRKMAQKSEWDLRQTAIVVASFGTLGTGCFAAAGTVANLIGCHYNTIKRHRAELIRLGWFTPVGRNRRAVVLNISNPLADHIRVPLLANHPDGPLVGDHETAQSDHLDGPLPVIDPKGSIPGDGSPEEGSADAAPQPSFCHEKKNHAATPVSEADSPGLAPDWCECFIDENGYVNMVCEEHTCGCGKPAPNYRLRYVDRKPQILFLCDEHSGMMRGFTWGQEEATYRKYGFFIPEIQAAA